MNTETKTTVTLPAPTAHAKAVFESRVFGSEQSTVQVENIKTQAAMLLDAINEIPTPNAEAGRLASLAKTSIEETVMWATKAVSRFNPSTSL